MPIEFKCPQCGKAIKAPDAYAGKTAKCPGCGAAIAVPAKEEEILDAETVEPLPQNSALDDMLKEEDEYKLASPNPYQSPAPPQENRKPCPACGEMIPSNAAMCRFCGEVFDPALKKARAKKDADPSDDMSVGDWVVAILCSGIGCIAGIVWMIQGKKKGGKMVLVSICAGLVWGVLRAILEASRHGR